MLMRHRLPEAGQLGILPQEPHLVVCQMPNAFHHMPKLVVVVLPWEQRAACVQLHEYATWIKQPRSSGQPNPWRTQ